MTGLLIYAAVPALAAMGAFAQEAGKAEPSWERPLGLALIAVALWLAYAAGGQP